MNRKSEKIKEVPKLRTRFHGMNQLLLYLRFHDSASYRLSRVVLSADNAAVSAGDLLFGRGIKKVLTKWNWCL